MNPLGHILTFYSYKGGVGRSMGLANVAALLAKWRQKVLVVDWDLEAPGIEAYFNIADPQISESRKSKPGVIDLIKAVEAGQELDWHDCLMTVSPFNEGEEIKIISAGKDDERYMPNVQHTNWDELFETKALGLYIEELRNSWKKEFDFVLLDSRTGITDIGGVCTIHLPDYLLIWFTTNRTSIDGVKRVAESARLAQDNLPFDRNPLLILPVPARDESYTEVELSEEWKKAIARDFGDFYREWIPLKVTPEDVVGKLRIPYIPFWSFGERLPVVEQGTADTQSIGLAYETLSRLIFFHFDWGGIEKDPEHSIEFLERATRVNPLRFGPEYADILNENALDLWKAKHPDESIKLAKEAAEIWQNLLDNNLNAYGPKLARARNFLSDCLSKEKDVPGAIFEANEAVNIYQRLYEINPIDFVEDLSASLTTLWKCVSESGDVEKTVEALKKATGIQQQLAVSKPMPIEPDLADGLFNLSNLLIDVNQFSEALTAAEQAVEVYRRLVIVNRKRYEPELANSLNTLSECLSNIGNIKPALVATKEAVEIFKELSLREPGRYEGDLAASINTFLDPIPQANIDDVPDFFMFFQEAMAIFRGLALKDPKRYEPGLAKNLNILPDLVLEKDDLQRDHLHDAYAAQQEAIAIFRRLTVSNPSLYEAELARSLFSMSKLSKKEDLTAARSAADEAYLIFNRLSQDSPTRYSEELDDVSKLLNELRLAQ
jgi:MinD-like ATPase involved in chromosome partitioning or flagellar assembly